MKTTLAHLALELVRENPRTSDLELVRRWVAQVRHDENLLNACLQQGANRAIAAARDYIGREQRALRRQQQQKKLAAVLAKAVTDVRAQAKELVNHIGNTKRARGD